MCVRNTQKSSSPANFRSAVEAHPSSDKKRLGARSLATKCRLELRSVEVSEFRDGQLGGGCLVSFPKQKPAEDEEALIKFLVTESASMGKRGKLIGQIQNIRPSPTARILVDQISSSTPQII
jgi:hypothetical protein